MDTPPASASPEAAFKAMKDMQTTLETLQSKVETLEGKVSSIKANVTNDNSPRPLVPVKMGRESGPDIDISGEDSDVDQRAVSNIAIPLLFSPNITIPCPYYNLSYLPPPPTPTYPPLHLPHTYHTYPPSPF